MIQINKNKSTTYFADAINIRKKKLSDLRCNSIAFPNNFHRANISNDLHEIYDDVNSQELAKLNIIVSVAGRMIAKRVMGKVTFITMQDMGGKIQLYVSSNEISKNIYNTYFKKLDLGDIIGVKGILFKTKKNELTIKCQIIELLTKSLYPLPDKFHGLIDQESRYRQRYLDLIVNEKTRQTFFLRSRLLLAIRNFMCNNKFIEVETPMIQMIPGGASADPFVTYYNSINHEMYLRISPELYLKRLVVGGFENIFEINRNFRNEGVSSHHNPEFTMMELYMAYANYNDLMSFIEKFFHTITKEILGTSLVQYGDYLFDFKSSFHKQTMKEAIIQHMNINDPKELDDLSKVIRLAKSLNIKIEKHWGLGRIQSKLFEVAVENKLIQPTFITEYPTEISPLARSCDHNAFTTERFELFIAGSEIGNGFSELNDSEEQTKRFMQQLEQNKNKSQDLDKMYDYDYIKALEYGLPPTAGFGIGIDRMVMLLTNNHSIRDVILFPTLRPNTT
uniref:Lysine--tRNA ligase n=1 Tax=Candidatus Aschnera chinzeii TaxID=1485666 RepID=A0AAT9G4I8_9ENTR|nr:MAG: lysine--tRNA ligase [Candidatus Aschnera chinzeii]